MKVLAVILGVVSTSCMPFNNPFSVEDYENGEGYYKYQNQTNYYRHPPGTAQPAIVGYR